MKQSAIEKMIIDLDAEFSIGDNPSPAADDLDFIQPVVNLSNEQDELQHYESNYGLIVWNVTQKTVTVQGIVLTEADVDLLPVRPGALDMEIMKRFGAKPVKFKHERTEAINFKTTNQIGDKK